MRVLIFAVCTGSDALGRFLCRDCVASCAKGLGEVGKVLPVVSFGLLVADWLIVHWERK